MTLGTAGNLLGAVWAHRHGTPGAAALARPRRRHPARRGGADRRRHELALRPAALHRGRCAPSAATADAQLVPRPGRDRRRARRRGRRARPSRPRRGRPSGAEHLVTLGDTRRRRVRRAARHPDDPDDRTRSPSPGATARPGTSLLFTALEHAGVAAVAGETPAQWHRRCLHSIRTSGVPERLRPGFWDNDGRCCGTAGCRRGVPRRLAAPRARRRPRLRAGARRRARRACASPTATAGLLALHRAPRRRPAAPARRRLDAGRGRHRGVPDATRARPPRGTYDAARRAARHLVEPARAGREDRALRPPGRTRRVRPSSSGSDPQRAVSSATSCRPLPCTCIRSLVAASATAWGDQALRTATVMAADSLSTSTQHPDPEWTTALVTSSDMQSAAVSVESASTSHSSRVSRSRRRAGPTAAGSPGTQNSTTSDPGSGVRTAAPGVLTWCACAVRERRAQLRAELGQGVRPRRRRRPGRCCRTPTKAPNVLPAADQGHGGQRPGPGALLALHEGRVRATEATHAAHHRPTAADSRVERHVVVGVQVAPRRRRLAGVVRGGEVQPAATALHQGHARATDAGQGGEPVQGVPGPGIGVAHGAQPPPRPRGSLRVPGGLRHGRGLPPRGGIGAKTERRARSAAMMGR